MEVLNRPLVRSQVKALPKGLNVTKAIWYRLADGTDIYFPNRKERKRNVLNGKSGQVQHIAIFGKKGIFIGIKKVYHHKKKEVSKTYNGKFLRFESYVNDKGQTRDRAVYEQRTCSRIVANNHSSK